MRKILYILLFLCASFYANAQILTVKDKVTQEPLELVIIYSKTRTPVVTNIEGKTDISTLKGIDTIHIRLVGYEPLIMSYQELLKQEFNIFMKLSNITLDEIVVSANKWVQQKRDVPSKITSIKSMDVMFYNPQTAADMLNITEEVFVQKSQLGGGSPMIRGFAANRVLIVVDGVRMNNAIFREGNLQNVISLDPFSIEKTEVIFGAGSVIYGSDAIGGVMNFYTTNPRPSFTDKPLIKGNAAVRYSSANFEKTGHIDLKVGLKKWAFVTGFTGSGFGDLRMGSNGPNEYLRNQYVTRINGVDSVVTNNDPLVQKYSGYSQMNMMQKIRFRPNNTWDINYGIHYSTTSDVPRYDRLIQVRNNTLRYGDWYYGPQKWLMNSLTVNYSNENILFDKLNTTFAHQFFEESRHNRNLNDSEITRRIENVMAISANLDFEKLLALNHELYYGLEAIVNEIASKAEVENILDKSTQPISTRYPDGSSWKSYAAYINYKYKLNTKISLVAGVRYNQIVIKASFDTTYFPNPTTDVDINKGAINGNLGVAYSPQEDLQLNVNLSTGFRAPNIDDLGKVFEPVQGYVVVPNPDLKPEYVYNGEIGIAKIFSNLIKLQFSGFYSLLNNALVRSNYLINDMATVQYDKTINSVQAIQNALNAYVWGIQSGIEIKLPEGFGISSHVNYQKGEEELEDGSKSPLRHVAPLFGSFHVTYARSRFKADVYTIYNGEIEYENLASSERDKPYIYAVDGNGNPYCPAWYTLNVKVLCRINSHLLASAGVENITDQRYRPYSSGIVASGRNFIISLSASL